MAAIRSRWSAARSPTTGTNWILATKLANQIGDDPNRGGLSRRWVLQAADESLKRLGTDYIDIYYLHKEDHATPLEETVRAMGDLMRQGKIRYFGVSNYRAWRVAEICNICDRLGIDRPIVSQPYYNAMNRMPEVEHFPACGYYGLGIVPYSPLARGVLTGKYRPDAAPDKDTRAGRNDKRMMQTEWRPESLKLAQEIKRHAEAKRHHRRAVRGVMGAEFVVRLGRDRGPPHRGAMGRLHQRARLSLHGRGRGADRPAGGERPSLDAGIQRSRPIRSRAGGRGRPARPDELMEPPSASSPLRVVSGLDYAPTVTG